MNSFSPKRSVIETEDSAIGGSPASTIRIITDENTSFFQVPQLFEDTNLVTVLRESYITSEYSLVSSAEKLGGIYVIPSQKSSSIWFGVIFLHQGPYVGGVFRFTIQFSEGFPTTSSVPILVFQPPIFHPCVHPVRGTFDLRRHFKSWNKAQNHVWQILRTVRAAFHRIELSTVNKEAHDLFLNDTGAFMLRAKNEVDKSLSRIYDPPPTDFIKDAHWIKFSPYDPKLHDQIRAKALKPIGKLNGCSKSSAESSNCYAVTSPPRSRGKSFLQAQSS